MKSFEIFAIIRNHPVPITYFSSSNPSEPHDICATFNEQLQESENSQYTLTFDMAKYYYERGQKRENIYLPLLLMGGKIRLELDDSTVIDLIIKSITPSTMTEENTIYSFTAQDEVSYLWARHNLGYTYENEQVENIYIITENVLRQNFITGWAVYNSENLPFADSLQNKPITLKVENSNPYNVIIEACNTLNCYLVVNYATKTLSFYQKDYVPFSGYRYNPYRNLASFSVDYNTDELTSILHVSGGTNEYDEIVSLVPAIPQSLQNLLAANARSESDEQNWTKWDTIEQFDGWYMKLYDELAVEYNNWLMEQEKLQEKNQPHADETEINRRRTELTKCLDFCRIATQVPHLGQFLYDFSFFEEVGYLSEPDVKNIEAMINVDMRKNNIYLKEMVPTQYMIEWQLAQSDTRLIEYGSEYEAEWKVIEEKNQYDATNLNAIEAKIDTEIRSNWDYFKNCIQLDGYENGIDIVQRYPHITYYKTQNETYEQLYTEAEEQVKTIEAEQKQIANHQSIEYINLEAQRTFYEQRKATYMTLFGTRKIVGHDVLGLYNYILSRIQEAWKDFVKTKPDTAVGLNAKIAEKQVANDTIWTALYRDYGQFIYEAQYENSDELDSESLYNQAIAYFETSKRPKANYSVDIIDVAALERIDMPRLTVGSKIKICHPEVKYLSKSQDLLVIGLSYTLRMPDKISVTVDTVQNYNSLVEKMLKSIK